MADQAELRHERDAYFEMAREMFNNAEFYRGIVRQIGELLGDAAYISDDGSRQESVLALKVPELVKALGDRCAQAEQQRDAAYREGRDDARRQLPSASYADACREADLIIARQRVEQAEAEAARLREELAEARGYLTAHEKLCLRLHELEQERAVMEQRIIHDTDHLNRFIACVMELEAKTTALTQERDTLRTELLERDDMREGV